MKIEIDHNGYQPPKSGLWLLQLLVVLLFMVFCSRFWYLQILRGNEFTRLAEANKTRIEKIFAPRGIIYDKNGEYLAENRISFGLSLIREDCPDIPTTLAHIATLIGIDREILQAKYDIARNKGRLFDPVPLLDDITFEQVAKIESQSIYFPGIQIVTQSKRTYPDGEAFAHILGYVAEATEAEIAADIDLALGDSVGRQGLELVVEKKLRGKKGSYRNKVDVLGKVLEKDLEVQPESGENIMLSLDSKLQHKIIEIMGDYSGTVVVMNPHTGQLYAMVTSPSYDNNLFVKGLSQAEWKELSTNDRYPLQNRAIQSTYPPGSVWKIMMAGMLLSHGVNPKTTVYCGGSVTLGTHTFRCWRAGGHGNVDMLTSLSQSCDVYYYQMGEKYGIDKISAFAQTCGFGKPTGIDLPNEKGGLVPSREWKYKRYNEKWQGGETLNVSIGQGQTLVTPLQLAVYISSLLNGGLLLKPQLLLDAEPEIRGHNPSSPEHIQMLHDFMVVTAKSGTARVLSQKNPEIIIGGKTGTAQVVKLRMSGTRRLKTNELELKERDHAWITSFAQYQGKDVVVVTMLEHGGGGSSAAGPVTRDIIKYIYEENPAVHIQ